MNGIAKEGDARMTLRQVADATGASYRTIARYAKNAGWTENGKTALLNEAQVSIVLEAMRQPVSSGRKANLANELQGTETALTPALRLEMLYRQIDKIKTAEIAKLKQEKEDLRVRLSESEEWYSVKRVLIATGKKYPWKPLKECSLRYGYEIKKVFDQNYEEVNAYHINVWNAVYGLEL